MVSSSAGPFPAPKPERNWVDGGWCTLGDGEFKRKVRLMLDLGAQRTIGSRSLFDAMAEDVRKGNLGAARVTSEIRNQWGEGCHGTKFRMVN